MATEVLTDAFVQINAVDLSDHVKQVTFNYKAEVLDETAMGDTTRTRIMGLLDWDFTVNFLMDFAASEVYATIQPLVGAAAFAIAVRHSKTDAISATNPEMQGNAVCPGLPIVVGSVGELQMAQVQFLSAGALTFDITP